MKRGFTGTADVPSALSGNADADKMSAVPVKPCSLVMTKRFAPNSPPKRARLIQTNAAA